MANEQHLAILRQGAEAWNQWRTDNPNVRPDLERADFAKTNFAEANLAKANLSWAKLTQANLYQANLHEATLNKVDFNEADLRGADLTGANLAGADLNWAKLLRANLNEAYLRHARLWGVDLSSATLMRTNLIEADLSNSARLWRADLRMADLRLANLMEADLRGANLSGANLSGAWLEQAHLVEANLDDATLHGCHVYGASVWNVSLERTSQRDLIVTPSEQASITVDDIEVAQFVYLLLENKRVRKIIDTITSKVVLILGRFVEERKRVLDALRDELRKRDYTPIIFDFDKPSSRDLTETVSTLAHMARFVIADITDAKSIPQELQKIVPNLPSLPVRPIILEDQYEYAMFKDFGGYLSVLPPYRYKDVNQLLGSLEEQVVGPALEKAQEIEKRRQEFEEGLARR